MLNNDNQFVFPTIMNEAIFVVWNCDEDVMVKREIAGETFDSKIEVGRLVFDTVLQRLGRVIHKEGDLLVLRVDNCLYDTLASRCLAAKISPAGLRSKIRVIKGGADA